MKNSIKTQEVLDILEEVRNRPGSTPQKESHNDSTAALAEALLIAEDGNGRRIHPDLTPATARTEAAAILRAAAGFAIVNEAMLRAALEKQGHIYAAVDTAAILAALATSPPEPPGFGGGSGRPEHWPPIESEAKGQGESRGPFVDYVPDGNQP